MHMYCVFTCVFMHVYCVFTCVFMHVYCVFTCVIIHTRVLCIYLCIHAHVLCIHLCIHARVLCICLCIHARVLCSFDVHTLLRHFLHWLFITLCLQCKFELTCGFYKFTSIAIVCGFACSVELVEGKQSKGASLSVCGFQGLI